MFRESFETVAGILSESALVRPFVVRTARRTLNVVYYHYVGVPTPHYQAFYSGCSIARFQSDLRRLANVFEFASLDDVLSNGSDGKRSGRPLMCVTFDDGFNLHDPGVMEVLNRYRIKATTFVITSCLGNRRLMWRHMLSAIQALADKEVILTQYNEMAQSAPLCRITSPHELLAASYRWSMKAKDNLALELWERCGMPPVQDYLDKYAPYFTWDSLKRWCAAGHSVGLHTHTHPDCSRLERADLVSEFFEPVEMLKSQLGVPAVAFSYPFGERLLPDLESEVFQTGNFMALFGIRGFCRRGFARSRLERAEAERPHLGWSVFAPLAFRSFSA